MNGGLSKDDGFLRLVRVTLDEDVADLDAASSRRLRQVRARAVAECSRRRTGGWLPFGILAAAMAVGFLVFFPSATRHTPQTPAIEDVELLTSDVDLDVLQNLDFYAWLAENPDAG